MLPEQKYRYGEFNGKNGAGKGRLFSKAKVTSERKSAQEGYTKDCWLYCLPPSSISRRYQVVLMVVSTMVRGQYVKEQRPGIDR